MLLLNVRVVLLGAVVQHKREPGAKYILIVRARPSDVKIFAIATRNVGVQNGSPYRGMVNEPTPYHRWTAMDR